MLKALFGCKSVERVLLFLLVNEKAYAHQLHRSLNISLTPIQKALTRLEKGGILKSERIGKKLIYQLNQQLPLAKEIEELLTKAYRTLPKSERKLYFSSEVKGVHERREGLQLLAKIWGQLKTVSQVTLIVTSSSKQAKQWDQKGKGCVVVSCHEDNIAFQEEGQWQDGMHYRNAFRWAWDREANLLSLEHLRFGEKHPVFLFHLAPSEQDLLKSLNPHLCGEDTYFGWLHFNELFLKMQIRTIGPYKNERVDYIYT